MKRRGPRTKWQRIVREVVFELLIGAAIGLAFDAVLGAYLPHRGCARTSHRHCEKKHTPEKNSVERRNKWQSTEA